MAASPFERVPPDATGAFQEAGTAMESKIAQAQTTALIITLVGSLLAGPTLAQEDPTFDVLTYNVKGLPALAIPDRTAEITAIAPKLEAYHAASTAMVMLQEVFDAGYYAILFDVGTITYPYTTPKGTGGDFNLGDGLNRMSDFGFTGFARTQWLDCFGSLGQFGSDCATNKGFSYATMELEEEVDVDVYNLHADAGQDEDSRDARRKNITQLIGAINATSGTADDESRAAVIVVGDTNSFYTRTGDDNIETLLTGTGVKDVWIELVNAGVVPGAGPDNDSGCDSDPSGAACELKDKIFYRSSDTLPLTPTVYEVLDEEFEDAEGTDLSDHLLVSATFSYTVVPEPSLVLCYFAALGVLARLRSR
jgi:hypothetical protein